MCQGRPWVWLSAAGTTLSTLWPIQKKSRGAFVSLFPAVVVPVLEGSQEVLEGSQEVVEGSQ